jgi:hypothetical protein
MPRKLLRGPIRMTTEVEALRTKIRQLYPKRQRGDLTEKVFQRELIERTLDLYRALLKARFHKGEAIQREHHVVRAHTRLTHTVLREPEQEAVSLFATDRRLFCVQSSLMPNRPPTADDKDQTVIREIPLMKNFSLTPRHQIRWGETGVGAVMGVFALLFASWLSFTGPFLIGLGAAGMVHGLILPTRWIEITVPGSDPSQDPIAIYALRKKSARNLVQFIQVRKGSG